jgi:valyl-tRNA synthetase
MDYIKHYVFDYYITCYQWLLIDGSQTSGAGLKKKQWVIKFLKHVIHDTLIMVSPIIPFNAENIFQAYTRQNKISIGMLSWPQNLVPIFFWLKNRSKSSQKFRQRISTT